MGWKSVAWTSCLLPVLAGCGSVHKLTTEAQFAHTECAIKHDLRKDAHSAWQCVREQHPRRAFTAEFHDGFLDGYVDYLDRGGGAQPPAVPPMKYVRGKKYYTPEGHCLINDYYLGFKYGADVAVASGRREFLTVPVLLPDTACPNGQVSVNPGAPVVPFKPLSPNPGAAPKPKSDTPPLPAPRELPKNNKFGEPKKSDDPPLLSPESPEQPAFPDEGIERPIPPLPKPEVPVIPPFNPTRPGGKFAPPQVPPNPDLLPIPDPPLPVPNWRFEPLPVPPDEPKRTTPPVLDPPQLTVPPSLKINLPPPPDTVPLLPISQETPPVLDAIPVIPFQHSTPAPTPVSNLLLRK
jgi:hypothetical protein